MNPIDLELTTEQQFELRALRDRAKGLSHAELVDLIVDLMRLNIGQRVMFTKMIKQGFEVNREN